MPGVAHSWDKHAYLGAVGVGIGTSMGFAAPFLFTPAYFCHYTGKVPIRKMVCILLVYQYLILASRGAGAQSVTVKASGCGFDPRSKKINIKYLFKFIFPFRLLLLWCQGKVRC